MSVSPNLKSRVFVKESKNLGFEVRCTADLKADGRLGFRQEAHAANELAQDIYRHASAMARITDPETVIELELWEAPDAKSS